LEPGQRIWSQVS